MSNARFGLAAVLLSVAGSCASCERYESKFSTLAEAKSSSAWRNGWLPRWLPSSAIDIAETHDIDTNAQLLTFRFDVLEKSALVEPLHSLSTDEVNAVEVRELGPPEWWPSELRTGDIESARNALNLEFFRRDDAVKYADGRVENSRTYVALTPDGVAFVWR